MNGGPKRFLTAEWRHLAMLNYAIDPAILRPLVPPGTDLDSWEGRTLVSMVGFLFLDTRVWGVAIPFHRDFEEVNLRFYVRRKAEDGWRRGVVFVKELVPRIAIAAVARIFYGERYQALAMSHHIALPRSQGDIGTVSYRWRIRGRDNHLTAEIEGESGEVGIGTEQEFITEHYWGYARQPDGGALEYRVEHPRWRVFNTRRTELECDVRSLYGDGFAACLSAAPVSAFVADGSAVTVYGGARI